MKLILLLGKSGEYLTYRAFVTDEALDKFIDKIHPLMIANIDGEQPLRKRLELVKDDYFPYAGAVWDFEIIDMDDVKPLT